MPTNTGSAHVRRWLPLMREVRDAWPNPSERPPLSLWAALIDIESGGAPNVISPQGAVGLGQIMPADYAGYSPALKRMFSGRPITARLREPRTNLQWSLRILVTQGYRRCGTWDKALMAYFTGRCDAPTATDATGTSGAQYVARIRSRRDVYLDLDRPDGSAPASLEHRIAALERRSHTHPAVTVAGPPLANSPPPPAQP